MDFLSEETKIVISSNVAKRFRKPRRNRYSTHLNFLFNGHKLLFPTPLKHDSLLNTVILIRLNDNRPRMFTGEI